MEELGTEFESLSDVKKRFQTNHPEFYETWKKLVKTTGVGLVKEIKDKLKIEYDFLKQLLDFKFRLVVDNNFVFAQIKGSLKRKQQIEKSFIYELLLSNSVQIFAPPKLQEELLDKINSVLEEDDRELALEYAALITSKIQIKDAQWVEDWKNANRFIGETDPDDVPYLALAFDIGSHGILSNDKVFHLQGDRKVWTYGDTGRMVTNYHSGMLAITLAGSTIYLFWYLLAMLGKAIWDIILDLFALLKLVATGAIKAISQIPPQFLILISVLGLAIFLTNDDYQEKGKEFIQKMKALISQVIDQIKAIIKKLVNSLEKLLEVMEPATTPLLEFLGFLLVQFYDMEKELSRLESASII
ncbi:MAG: PIN domain-containing protein [Cyclobacteriaceae bacterium]